MHDLNLSALYFDRLAVMDRGSLIADGTPDAVLGDDNVLSRFGADLMRTRHPQTGAVQVATRRTER
jgi:iron complex transport system ATP-binding protein